MELFKELINKKVLVFTGAGISVASGVAPFRGKDGLYEGLNPYDLATAEAFFRQPVTVWNWYLMRIHNAENARPNSAHLALAEMETRAQRFSLVTSNVDELHEQAGSRRVFHLHGRIHQRRCVDCHSTEEVLPADLPESVDEESLFRCGCGGLQRPNVVWFGEFPWAEAIEVVQNELSDADLVLEVGSSGVVSYGFAETAASHGIPVLRINPEPEEAPGITCWPEAAETALPQLIS